MITREQLAKKLVSWATARRQWYIRTNRQDRLEGDTLLRLAAAMLLTGEGTNMSKQMRYPEYLNEHKGTREDPHNAATFRFYGITQDEYNHWAYLAPGEADKYITQLAVEYGCCIRLGGDNVVGDNMGNKLLLLCENHYG